MVRILSCSERRAGVCFFVASVQQFGPCINTVWKVFPRRTIGRQRGRWIPFDDEHVMRPVVWLYPRGQEVVVRCPELSVEVLVSPQRPQPVWAVQPPAGRNIHHRKLSQTANLTHLPVRVALVMPQLALIICFAHSIIIPFVSQLVVLVRIVQLLCQLLPPLSFLVFLLCFSCTKMSRTLCCLHRRHGSKC